MISLPALLLGKSPCTKARLCCSLSLFSLFIRGNVRRLHNKRLPFLGGRRGLRGGALGLLGLLY